MKIQTSFNVSKVRDEHKSELDDLVKDDRHLIAVSGEISKAIGIDPLKTVNTPTGDELHAVPTENKLTAEQRLKIETAAITLSGVALPAAKIYLPGLSGSIDGIELVFAGKTAFDAWTDPERTSIITPLLKTSRAFFELLDVAQIAVPSLKNVPYLDHIGVLIKVGDSIFQFYTTTSDIVAGKEKK